MSWAVTFIRRCLFRLGGFLKRLGLVDVDDSGVGLVYVIWYSFFPFVSVYTGIGIWELVLHRVCETVVGCYLYGAIRFYSFV